jgi:hypothetical protein
MLSARGRGRNAHSTVERLSVFAPVVCTKETDGGRSSTLFPVIRFECEGPPAARPWAADRLWQGYPRRVTSWAATRGMSVYVDERSR